MEVRCLKCARLLGCFSDSRKQPPSAVSVVQGYFALPVKTTLEKGSAMAAQNLTTLLDTAASKPDSVAALDVVKVLIPDVPGSDLS